MRAREPEVTGAVDRDGVSVAYDVFHPDGAVTVLLLPTWQVAHDPHWKAQVPVLARRHRVVVLHGRGTGRSDRPTDPALYDDELTVGDAIAVLDALGVDRAVVAGVSVGAAVAVHLAAHHPDRVLGTALIGSMIVLSPLSPERMRHRFDDVHDEREGWALHNEMVWRTDFPRFVEFFWDQVLTEPHSTKLREDGVAWTMDTGAEVLTATEHRRMLGRRPREVVESLQAMRGRSPVLVVHGTDDAVSPVDWGEKVAELTGGDLLLIDGGGHVPHARDPIKVNQALLELIDRSAPADRRPARRTVWTRALRRPRRALFLSSPIGLGHARRDLAIARELRALRPDVEIDWLTQSPVTAFLDAAGEALHPAAAHLVNESAHFESEAHEHSLHAFQAMRRMDEVLVSNFSVVQEVVDAGDHDLVVGDEAWDVDHFWHENPELKRTAFAWLTDFVGWLPMPEGGEPEAALTADCNAEMLEHVERFGRVLDRTLFTGDPDDVVAGAFGPGLPEIRSWTGWHFDFTGYITGFTPPDEEQRAALRASLGPSDDGPLVIATVGGTAAGAHLLRKVIAAYPYARKAIGGLRLLVVCGPRIDPASFDAPAGVEVRGWVPDLHLLLAAADAAIVQGGLTTTMELVAAGRPFLSFPLANHFEQQRHVRHRLERHGAHRSLDLAAVDPEGIADALVDALATPVAYRPVPTDGAARAAALLSELL